MSWAPRDYTHQGQSTPTPATVPPQTFHDDEPLPTYAAGLEQYTEEGVLEEDDYQLPAWHRLEIRRQGYAHDRELARLGQWMRRGVREE